MAIEQRGGVIQHLRRAMFLRDGAGLTDGQLLESYIRRRDEAALTALVQRHGPMVWGVCRRVLGHYHDAEDAFQATFLVLVRRAASIASRELLANWLYGVARQTAMKARATAANRKVRETQATEMPEPAVIEQDPWNDLRPLLDQELGRLPDIHRVVIVLCDLEGKTRKEAARHLGLHEGTVGSRLARARAMLAKRLARRGVVLSGAALAAVLLRNVALAGVPNSVASSTINAASLFPAGHAAAGGVISPKVAALTEGVLKAMLMSKLKAALAVLLILGFVATGATILTCRTAAGQKGKEPTAEKPVEPAAKQEKEKDKEIVTAWGKEVGGLQAGLGFLPGQKRAYTYGETAKLVVRVRNVGKETVKFQYLREFFMENPPAVTDGTGKPLILPKVSVLGLIHLPVDVTLAPGKDIELTGSQPFYELKLELSPAYGTGKVQIQYERVFGNSSIGSIKLDPAVSKLATGKLELEVKADPLAADDGKAEKDDARTSLFDAIKALNAKASHDAVGKDEAPITEPEVVAAIRAAQRPEDPAVTDKLFDAFKKVAETKQLLPGAELEAIGGSWDPGASFVYDVWWVRVRMPKDAGGTYAFVIRERIIRSRTLQEELARLEKKRPGEGELAIVDGGRLRAAINDLKARIEKMKTK